MQRKPGRSKPTKSDAVYAQIPTRTLTAFAQDPSVRDANGPITTQIVVPAERLAPGPCGHRIQVIDFDATARVRYKSVRIAPDEDRFARVGNRDKLIDDPEFHQQHVYATAMSTLTTFEAALGRHLHWGFLSRSHQLKIAPHAFAEPNAYYSRADEAVYFGYFFLRQKPVFSCLSRDVVVHEVTHACLDGLRNMLIRPSSADQAAFHEGFADLIAIFSLFRSPELIERFLGPGVPGQPQLIQSRRVSREALSQKVFFGLAEQMGEALARVRGRALRHSLELENKDPREFLKEEFQEPHRRGELFVAAFLRAFLNIWDARLVQLGRNFNTNAFLNRSMVAELGCAVAGQLMRMAIRAIDYMPPVDIRFGDYLSALLTADSELYASDAKFHYRTHLRQAFAHFKITPSSNHGEGIWDRPRHAFDYSGVHFEPMQREPDALYRFIWQNWKALELHDEAFTRLISVRPCIRAGADGFVLRETVAEYLQTLEVFPADLKRLKIESPGKLPADRKFRLYGSGVLILDEFGRVKYHVGHGIQNRTQQGLQHQRLKYLYERGQLPELPGGSHPFAELHRARAHRIDPYRKERW